MACVWLSNDSQSHHNLQVWPPKTWRTSRSQTYHMVSILQKAWLLRVDNSSLYWLTHQNWTWICHAVNRIFNPIIANEAELSHGAHQNCQIIIQQLICPNLSDFSRLDCQSRATYCAIYGKMELIYCIYAAFNWIPWPLLFVMGWMKMKIYLIVFTVNILTESSSFYRREDDSFYC